MAWLSGWTYRKKLTTDSNGISLSANVTNKQVDIRMTSAETAFWNHVKSDGGDVRFTSADGVTLLKKCTIKFDGTGDDALYKVKIPTVDYITDTVIYAYYGNSSATTDDDIPNTLESDTQAYWPLDLNHASGAFADIASTNDGTNTGTTDAAGQVGRGRDFSGTGQYIACGTGMGLTGARTIVASINGVHGAAALHAILAKYGTASGAVQDFYLAIYQQKIRALISQGSPTGFVKITNGGTTLTDNVTYIIGLSWDNSVATNNIEVWLGGINDSSTYANTADFTVALATTEGLIIGGRNASAPISLYDGIIDEVAVFNTVKSADWWKVENASRIGTWLTIGAEETLLDTITLTDSISITKYFTLTDSIALSESFLLNGATYIFVTDSIALADTAFQSYKEVIATDGINMVEVAGSVNQNSLFFAVTGFPSGQTVEYRIKNQNGVIVQDWTAVGVDEDEEIPGYSTYSITNIILDNGFQGKVSWRINGTTYYAVEILNYFESFVFGQITVGDIEASEVLAKEATVAANGTAIALLPTLAEIEGSVKWNKLDDLHDEALGRWVLDKDAKTLTLYRASGAVLKVFDLIEPSAGSPVPAFVERTPR